MGLIDVASSNSVWRGMEYYENKKVITWSKTGPTAYDGTVSGSAGSEYSVTIDLAHPRKSKCNCPFADGRRVVCKHMIALYFTVEPQAAADFNKQVEEWEQEEESQREEHFNELYEYVHSLSKAELQTELLEALLQLEEEEDDYYW